MRLLVFVKNFRGGIFLKIIEKIPPEFPQIPARDSVLAGNKVIYKIINTTSLNKSHLF